MDDIIHEGQGQRAQLDKENQRARMAELVVIKYEMDGGGSRISVSPG
jgi:hypothetical protein